LEKIVIETAGTKSEILVGERWDKAGELLPRTGVIIISDDNVFRLYGDKFPPFPVFTIMPGESSKKLEIVELLAEKLLGAGIDRTGFILAIGGGVVCDIAGFLASVYMRGVRCAYVSTTLLSQVDASTGGKNGVNLGNTKNVIGTFLQPQFVVCDPAMLMTLNDEEYLSGLAELIKTALIGDEKLFGLIEENHDKIICRDRELLELLISMAIKYKASVVSEDEREAGLRRVLNFGHTFGHAIEMNKSTKHGFAVAAGMELAVSYSFYRGYIEVSEKDRIIALLKKFDLLRYYDVSDNQLYQYIVNDKKKSGSEIYFVFTSGIGRAFSEKVPVSEILDFYRQDRKDRKNRLL
jgi:3-dehydroquinate synthase